MEEHKTYPLYIPQTLDSPMVKFSDLILLASGDGDIAHPIFIVVQYRGCGVENRGSIWNRKQLIAYCLDELLDTVALQDACNFKGKK